jgi:hypothetical protein
MIPKHDLTFMICSSLEQIYKSIGSQEAIVYKVEKQLTVTRNCLTFSPI